MNMGNTEAQLIITKSKSAEVKSGYEELTVKEMVRRGFSATKIESIVRKGGTPDPDAPEKISQAGEVKGKIKASAKAVAPLMHLTGMPAPSGATSGSTEAVLQIAANVFAAGTESALSEAGAAPKKLPKAKAKSKGKAALQAPKTIKDRLEDCRKELKKEYNAANICYDLPKTDKLRTEMEKHKGDLENKMDLMKELDDDGAEDSLDDCKAMVRAVVAELQRKEVRRRLSYEMNLVRLAKTIGRGYSSVKHAAEIARTVDKSVREGDGHHQESLGKDPTMTKEQAIAM
ncbi:unnamed protein product, partial [Symbiodinium sp. KB8]